MVSRAREDGGRPGFLQNASGAALHSTFAQSFVQFVCAYPWPFIRRSIALIRPEMVGNLFYGFG